MAVNCTTQTIPLYNWVAASDGIIRGLDPTGSYGNLGYPAETGDYYVTPVGSDSNDGLTWETAFATPLKALQTMSPGQTAVVRSGITASLSCNDIQANGGTALAWKTLIGEYPGTIWNGNITSINDQVPVGPSYVNIKQFIFKQDVLQVSTYITASYMRLMQCIWYGTQNVAYSRNMLCKNSEYVLFEDVAFAGPGGRYMGQLSTCDKMVIRRAVVRADRGWVGQAGLPSGGLQIYSCTNVEIQQPIGIDCVEPNANIGFLSAINMSANLASPVMTGIVFRNPYSMDSPFNGILLEGKEAAFTAEVINPVSIRNRNGIAFDAFYSQTSSATVTGGELSNNTSAGGSSFGANRFNASASAGSTFTVTGTNIYGNSGGALATGVTNGGGITTLDQQWPYATTKRIGAAGTLWGETDYYADTTDNLFPYPYEDVIQQVFRWYENADSSISGDRGFCADGQTLTDYMWRVV